MKAVFRGYYISVIIFLITVLVFYFWGEISKGIPDLSLYSRIILYLIPVIGGLIAGWHSEAGQGFSGGFYYGILVFITVSLFFIWFIPLLLEFRPMLITLCYLLTVPALAGGFAGNIKRLKPAFFDKQIIDE